MSVPSCLRKLVFGFPLLFFGAILFVFAIWICYILNSPLAIIVDLGVKELQFKIAQDVTQESIRFGRSDRPNEGLRPIPFARLTLANFEFASIPGEYARSNDDKCETYGAMEIHSASTSVAPTRLAVAAPTLSAASSVGKLDVLEMKPGFVSMKATGRPPSTLVVVHNCARQYGRIDTNKFMLTTNGRVAGQQRTDGFAAGELPQDAHSSRRSCAGEDGWNFQAGELRNEAKFYVVCNTKDQSTDLRVHVDFPPSARSAPTGRDHKQPMIALRTNESISITQIALSTTDQEGPASSALVKDTEIQFPDYSPDLKREITATHELLITPSAMQISRLVFHVEDGTFDVRLEGTVTSLLRKRQRSEEPHNLRPDFFDVLSHHNRMKLVWPVALLFLGAFFQLLTTLLANRWDKR